MGSNNKTIAKNTFFLYIRMFITMGVSLYTSRVVLNTLGVTDFGTYNLVGGIVVLFSFINVAMTGATQRFLNFEMAKNSDEAVRRVFSVSTNAHLLIMLIIVLLAETIGLWFLNYKLNIPVDRMNAANIVFQFSILTFCFSILKVPYNASVIAYEKMSFYAWISIIEVVLKLLIVFLLVVFAFDKLILYSILVFGVSVVVFLSYRFFCRRMFASCHYKFYRDKGLFKELLSFSGWSMFGNMALIGSNQGISMILNIFLGVTINAAMGIAAQVNTAIYSFVSNFQMAFNPQIIKTYASGDMTGHKKLLFQASKLSYYLLFVLALPILFNTQYILTLWLKIVPDYAVVFTQLIIIFSLIDALAGPFWVSVNATGKIKRYQIVVSIILILNLPTAYLLLYYGFSPIYVLVSKIIINFILFLFRLNFVRSIIKFSFLEIFKNVYLQVILVSSVSCFVLFEFKRSFFVRNLDFIHLLMFTFFAVFFIVFIIIFIGISHSERRLIYNFTKERIKKIK